MILTALLVAMNVALLLVFVTRAPQRSPAAAGEAGSSASAAQRGVYAVTGVVEELRMDSSNVVVRHEAIPGFMMAMKMPFTARDTREIANLKQGDRITFRLLVTDDDSWIDTVQRQGVVEAPPATFPYEQSRIVRDVEPLEIGQPMPDYVFTNQLGQRVRLADFRGRALALTFVFTRCPLPDFCPRMMKNFSQVHEALQARAGGSTNWHLVTVTIDPAFDTPEVLRRYAETYNYDARRWTLLTGAMIDIDALTEQLGVVFRRQTPDALPDHNLRTAVIDTEGRLRNLIIGNTWKPGEVVDEVLGVLGIPTGVVTNAPAPGGGG